VRFSNLVSKLAWSIPMLLIVLFAWHQSHFQYDVYVEGDFGLIVHRLSVVAVVMLAAVSWLRSYPKPLVQMAYAYILMVVVYGFISHSLTSDGTLRTLVEAILFSLIMLPVVSDKRMLCLFIRINLVLGVALIALNTVPVLHWLNVLTLPNESVPRVGGVPGEEYGFQDPIHFGLFGLTEDFPYLGNPFETARLQGFSLEPIHWSYFVFLTFASVLFLWALNDGARKRVRNALLLTLIAVHLFFVYSTTAFITATAWLGVITLMVLARRFFSLGKNETLLGWLVLVITPGLLIPFALVLAPNVAVILVADDILNKGSNWQDKIDFLSMGVALYTRFLPILGEAPSASHNLVLGLYITFGYFLLLPLLAFFWMFIKRTFAAQSLSLVAGISITLLTHMLVVPLQFFYPSGAMWIMMAAGVAYHASRSRPTFAVTAIKGPAPRLAIQTG